MSFPSAHPLSPFFRDALGDGPLHQAARLNSGALVRRHVQDGAHIEALDAEGLTPLARACEMKHWDAACELLDARADFMAPLASGSPCALALTHAPTNFFSIHHARALVEARWNARRAPLPAWTQPSALEIAACEAFGLDGAFPHVFFEEAPPACAAAAAALVLGSPGRSLSGSAAGLAALDDLADRALDIPSACGFLSRRGDDIPTSCAGLGLDGPLSKALALGYPPDGRPGARSAPLEQALRSRWQPMIDLLLLAGADPRKPAGYPAMDAFALAARLGIHPGTALGLHGALREKEALQKDLAALAGAQAHAAPRRSSARL